MKSRFLEWATGRGHDIVRYGPSFAASSAVLRALGLAAVPRFLDEAREVGVRDKEAWLYALVRSRRPERVVETGVCEGWSTAAMLKAMRANATGRLWSVDLPTYDPAGSVNADGRREGAVIPGGMEPGFEVPAYLRDRWTLRLGDARQVLPKLFDEVGPVDLFVHDSEHSHAHQRWEYELAWEYLRPLGILASDDTDWTPAFREFARLHDPAGHRTLDLGRRGLIGRPA